MIFDQVQFKFWIRIQIHNLELLIRILQKYFLALQIQIWINNTDRYRYLVEQSHDELIRLRASQIKAGPATTRRFITRLVVILN
jgi:hypothetical protein